MSEVADCCCCGFVCIREQQVGVITYCGKFDRLVNPGFHCLYFPCCYKLYHRANLKIQYMDCECETKTLDNVFVKVQLGVLYQIIEDKVGDAVFKLSNVNAQISSYVYDVVRSTIPTMNLDDAFASKGKVARAVEDELSEIMRNYGYKINAALVTDLDPNPQIKAAMNDINAASRIREANKEKADADKILMVKAAEADAEAKYLSGLGVAKQRKALMEGLQQTVVNFSSEVEGTNAKDVMDLLLVTQYFDMIRDLGKNNKSGSSLFLPHGPHSISKLREDLKDSFGK